MIQHSKENPMAPNLLLHTLHRFLFFLLCIIPGYTWALGLGDIVLKSTPDAPLKAKIKLLAIRPEELKDLRAGLASHRDFEWVGIHRTAILDQLKFSPAITEGDVAYILVSSEAPIQQSTLNFLVEVKWRGKRLLREYSIELAPLGPMSIPAILEPETISAPVHDSSRTMTTSAEHASNTETTRQPDPESSRTDSAEQQTSDVSAADSKASQQTITYTSSPGDTLAVIAKRFRPDNSINLAQMMITIQKINPEAFIKENINGLKSNVTLRIPGQDEVNQISATEAMTEVKQHNKLWRNRNRSTAIKTTESDAPALGKDPIKHVAAEKKKEEPDVSADADKPEQEPPEVKSDTVEMVKQEDENAPRNPMENGQLELISEQKPSTDAGVYTIAPKEYIENLERSADLTKELAESRRLETEEVKGRIQRLETVILQQKRLITLQTEQLQALNERVRIMAQNNEEAPDRVHWLWFSIWALTATLGLLLFYLAYNKTSKK